MSRFLSLLFIPQEKNNHRALLLHPSFLGLFIAVYLLNQSLIRSLTIVRPGILGYSSEITANKVLVLTNQQRQKQHLPPLKSSPVLSASAALKAQDMFAANYWAHTSPAGKSPWEFFKGVDYQYSIAGENLAKDFYDTESMVKAWMKSPTHRANIISDKYQETGIAVVNGILGGIKTTLVVQHFATPLNAPAASLPPAAPQLAAPAEVLADQSRTPVSPLFISKLVSGLMFLVILSVLVVDAYLTLKNRTYRLSGSSAGHVGFLAIIFLLLLFTRQGTIF